MKCKNWPVGVCTWSLQQDIAGVAKTLKTLGIEHVHLAVRAALGGDGRDYLKVVKAQMWTVTSTMIDFPQEDYSTLDSIKVTGGVVPDDCWEQNRRLFVGAAAVTADLGVPYLSMHAGFIDESDPAHAKKVSDRILALADAAADRQITLLLETGQETADELRHFLEQLDHPAIGVNFDPANMILYDKGEPVEAIRTLAPWVKHLHVKDAIRTQKPGTWGAEVPWGQGQVNPDAFLAALQEVGFTGAMAIEREAGDNRVEDIKLAAKRLASYG